MKINIKKPEKTEENKLFRGLGMVSGNNSSRLLLDYKALHPERYRELLQLMFGEDNLNITHLKLEMGSDINSSSGTEPAVMRSREENANVTRGAGYQLACDAQKVNPSLTLDMLYWSEPKWVADSDDVFDARYKWFTETLKAAYNTYGIKFDYISANRNERAVEPEWIKYLSKNLRYEKNCPYDFARIKIVAADEENSWRISDLMIEDEELRDSVDIVASHYTSHSTSNTEALSHKYKKEIWFSEGCPPMSYSKGTSRFDGCGLSGINGVLDIADRIIAMYPCGSMTLYEFQPVVSAYYDGVCYCHKQLIDAKEPWSGYYSIESGFYMALHFSKFIKKGWQFIDGACGCDGEKGGDGHALVNTVHSYMTAYDPYTKDISIVISNPTDKTLTYSFSLEGFEKESLSLDVWETRGSDGGEYDKNYFKRVKTISPDNKNRHFEFDLEVLPLSLMTISSLKVDIPVFKPLQSQVLQLPYCDDFSYPDYPEDFLKNRGYTPLFTTDQGGAFEVRKINGKNILMQMITRDTKAEEWGYTPLPITNLGDDRWFNYEISAKVNLHNNASDCYGGIGLRFCQACREHSGYSLLIFGDGHWEFLRNGEIKNKGNYAVKPSLLLKLSAEWNNISCFIDRKEILRYKDRTALPAGRAALYSSYDNNYFEYLVIEPVKSDSVYVSRIDDTDKKFEYEGAWEHILMAGFGDYKRTLSVGKENAALTLSFNGKGFCIFAESKSNCEISVRVDGKHYHKNKKVKPTDRRETICFISGLNNGEHKAEIVVISGELTVDGAEIIT